MKTVIVHEIRIVMANFCCVDGYAAISVRYICQVNRKLKLMLKFMLNHCKVVNVSYVPIFLIKKPLRFAANRPYKKPHVSRRSICCRRSLGLPLLHSH